MKHGTRRCVVLAGVLWAGQAMAQDLRVRQDDIIIDPTGNTLEVQDAQGRMDRGEPETLRNDVANNDYVIRYENEQAEFKRLEITIKRIGSDRRLKIERNDSSKRLEFYINGDRVGTYCDIYVTGACRGAGLPREFSGTVGACTVWTALSGQGTACDAGKRILLDYP